MKNILIFSFYTPGTFSIQFHFFFFFHFFNSSNIFETFVNNEKDHYNVY